jgi:hypothetical protein
MRRLSRFQEDLIIVMFLSLCILAMYSFAGTSDQLDELTAAQKEAVVARW